MHVSFVYKYVQHIVHSIYLVMEVETLQRVIEAEFKVPSNG